MRADHPSVVQFAELLAKLDDPFSERHEVLVEAGMNEGELSALRERWTPHLAERSVAEQFRRAYASTRSARRGRGPKEAPDIDPLDGTAEAIPIAGPALPFQTGSAEHVEVSRIPEARELQDQSGETMTIPVLRVVEPPWPFK